MKSRLGAWLGSFVFFWIAPATVGGLIPYLLTDWRTEPPLLGGSLGRILGGLLIAGGTAAVVESFARFAIQGRGTPAPIAQTERLVVSGLYRHVRNPMYVGVLAAIVGQAVLLGRVVLLGYAALVWLLFHSFVLLYEEPTLRSRFGASYDGYRAGVRRWRPRLTPWQDASRR